MRVPLSATKRTGARFGYRSPEVGKSEQALCVVLSDGRGTWKEHRCVECSPY
jgi:hypothetical protein